MCQLCCCNWISRAFSFAWRARLRAETRILQNIAKFNKNAGKICLKIKKNLHNILTFGNLWYKLLAIKQKDC